MVRRIKIIACHVLEDEIRAAAFQAGISITEEYLTAGLHETPERLKKELQQSIDRSSAEKDGEEPAWDALVIGYGLCGRGTVGLTAGTVPLVIPRVHDCIAMFLGSNKRYRDQFRLNPGTFYMTPGWYRHKTQPMAVKKNRDRLVEGNWDISAGFDSIKEKYGRDNAKEIYSFLNSWKRNYSRSVYINTGAGLPDSCGDYAKDLAGELGWEYEKLEGSLDLFLQMLTAEETSDEILVVPPGWVTAYDPLQNGLYAHLPGNETDGIWARALPGPPDSAESTGPVSGNPGRRGLGLGIDAGGTYTDAVIYDYGSGRMLASAKAETTHWDFTAGINKALDCLDRDLLRKTVITVVSTTLATNAIVEDRGRRVGLLLMPLAEIIPGQINHSYWRRIGGRLSILGEEIEPVSADEVSRAAAEMIERQQVEAFAVSGYGSMANPVHEKLVKDLIERQTGLSVCCGHELSSTLDFFVRANTAVLNAGIIPLVDEFINGLESSLEKREIEGRLMIVRGDGSLMSREKALLHPVETTLSGPAASIAGAMYLAGSDDSVIIDVGGTTSDIGTTSGGRIRLAEDGARVGRWKTHVKAVDMVTLGAGGDSRIRISGRQLTAGPARVAPIGRLHEIEGHEAAIDFLEKLHPDFYSSTASMEVLSLSGKALPGRLSTEEQRIAELLSERPYPVKELAARLTSGLWNILGTGRLESSAAVQRYGLTPSDLMTASGDFALWPAEISSRIAGLYSRIQGCSISEFTGMVFELISDKLLQALVLQELEVPGEAVEEITGDPAFIGLMKNMKGSAKALRIKPELKTRLVGVGAAAPWLLKRLAEHLGSGLVCPENAAVANAIGAVCSRVRVLGHASVLPDASGGFVVSGLKQRGSFEKLP